MPVHREEGRFVARIELSAEFDERYEGDEDGYGWLESWRTRVQPRLVRVLFEELRREPRFAALATSRGHDPEEEIEIAVRFEPRRSSDGG